MKASLLTDGYIVHKLDRNVPELSALSKEQCKRPIKLQEVTTKISWELNRKIDSEDENLKYQLRGIQKNTIGMEYLLRSEYLKCADITESVSSVFSDTVKYRNKLHFLTHESITISPREYQNLIKMVDFFNENLVSKHNDLCDDLGKEASYLLKPFDYHSN